MCINADLHSAVFLSLSFARATARSHLFIYFGFVSIFITSNKYVCVYVNKEGEHNELWFLMRKRCQHHAQ